MIGESYSPKCALYNYSYLNCLRQTKHIQLVNYKDFWVTPSIFPYFVYASYVIRDFPVQILLPLKPVYQTHSRALDVHFLIDLLFHC